MTGTEITDKRSKIKAANSSTDSGVAGRIMTTAASYARRRVFIKGFLVAQASSTTAFTVVGSRQQRRTIRG